MPRSAALAAALTAPLRSPVPASAGSGDGDNDAVFCTSTVTADAPQFLENTGGPPFVTTTIPIDAMKCQGAVLADLNGDGEPRELLLLNSKLGGRQVLVYAGTDADSGDLTWTAETPLDWIGEPRCAAVGNVVGDTLCVAALPFARDASRLPR